MTTMCKHDQERAADNRADFEIRVITEVDLDAAARIADQQFTARAAKLFGNRADRAHCFHRDLLDVLRLAYGNSFFGAYEGGRLIGFAVLTDPRRSLWMSALGSSFVFKAGRHWIAGRYGFPLALVSRAARSLFGKSAEHHASVADSPCVYIIAVDRAWTGKGVGTRLLDEAYKSCAGRFRRMWLLVESENAGAVQLYERKGFRIANTNAGEHLMIWDFPEVGR